MPKRKRPSPEDLPSKIFHARKLLTKALKTAKAFEQRKLLRRENEAEVLLLKAVDLPGLAEHHINKKLKIKSEFPTNNVTARLLNTKPVKETMKDVAALLGLEVSTDKPSILPAIKTIETENAIRPTQDSNEEAVSPIQKIGDFPKTFRTEEALGLVSGSEVDTDSELESDSEMIPPTPPDRVQRKQESRREESANPNPQSTTFLPSLTMGGYWSGSESAEDIDEAPRKNRRGQRARRQIWEQKYGAKANHMKSQKVQRHPHIREHVHARTPVEKAVDDKPIHPSWEAAKRAKEQKQAQFQGKKMVFD